MVLSQVIVFLGWVQRSETHHLHFGEWGVTFNFTHPTRCLKMKRRLLRFARNDTEVPFVVRQACPELDEGLTANGIARSVRGLARRGW